MPFLIPASIFFLFQIYLKGCLSLSSPSPTLNHTENTSQQICSPKHTQMFCRIQASWAIGMNSNARKIPKHTRHIIFPWNRGTVSILVHPLSRILHDTDSHYMHPFSTDIYNQKCQAFQLSADSTYFLWLLWAVRTRQEFWVCLGELTPDPKLGAPLLRV